MRKKIISIMMWLISFSLFSTSINAALDLELTQGIDTAIPIAVVPFAEHPEISEIVSADLKNSGRFRLIESSSMGQLPRDISNIDYSYWLGKKINNVVMGTVISGLGKYQVNIQLFDIYGHSVLLNKQFVSTKGQLRHLAHRISDLIYQQLTGERGVFSTKIAYILAQKKSAKQVKYSLMVADADGYIPKQLLVSNEPIMSPAWSPDGKNIAYVSFEGRNSAIYVQNVATGSRHILSKHPGINGAPAWSPDGNSIALVLTLTGYPKIYTIDLATSRLQQITDGASLDTEPSWSPDGKSIVFTSNNGGSPQIYQIFIGSKNPKRLSYHGSYNARGVFTANGKNIVMLNRDDGRFNIAVQDLKTGRLNILSDLGINKSPSVAANGSMVVYATIFDGRGVLGESSIDGKVKLRLPAQEGDVQDPAWSPFLD
jgi:TolB protein